MAEYVFKRYEKKYIINIQQYNDIVKQLEYNTVPDKYGETDVCNIYFDTPDYRIIRASIEKPVYKEKLRIRCYGTPDNDSYGFVELKKKYKGVVYKRRIKTPYLDGLDFMLNKGDSIADSQIKREIGYFKELYTDLRPSADIFYKRQAFLDRNNPFVRFTFDRDLCFRNYDYDLQKGIYGENVTDTNQIVMEIKTPGGMPLWAKDMLTEMEIYPTSFSKYGTAYKKYILKGAFSYDR